MKRKAALAALAAVLTIGGITGCGNTAQQTGESAQAETVQATEGQTQMESIDTAEAVQTQEAQTEEAQEKAPKYVFLFIGDGMSYPQIQLTNYFISASQEESAGTATVDGEERKAFSPARTS